MVNIFKIPFDQLPSEVSIFPLPGALLLPGGRLPLNIFEPRYVSMVLDALGEQRLIGMIQTLEQGSNIVSDNAEIFKVGCVGRIVSFSETADGRMGIVLDGICRFKVVSENTCRNGYRRIQSDFTPYEADMKGSVEKIDRDIFLKLLGDYFSTEKINLDLGGIRDVGDKNLIANLAMMCPFNLQEKQALLEARDFGHMIDIIISLMEMAVRTGRGSTIKH